MKYTQRLTPAWILVLFAALLSACSDDSVQEKDSFVKIISMQPPLSETLVAGSHVDFEIGVKYSHKEGPAVIALVIQRAEANFLPLANEFEIVPQGEGRLTLKASADIPDTKAIQVITPLTPQGKDQDAVVDSRVYKVVPGHGREI